MKLARTRSTAAAATAVLAVLALATACNRESTDSAGSGDDKPAIGIDLPRSDTDFWNSYIKYIDAVRQGARARACRPPTRRTTSPS